MGMNDAEIERVVNDLQYLVGASLQTLWQPARDRVVMGFSEGTLLLLVPRGPLARLHSVDRRPKNPPKPFSFQGACRSRLHGPLTSLRKVAGDRVVQLRFGDMGLELRLTGRSGGLWLVQWPAEGAPTVVAAYDGPAPEQLRELPARGEAPSDVPRFEPRPGPRGWELGARDYFETLERARLRDELKTRVEMGLRKAVARKERLLENLEADLRNADRAPQLRHQADLLAANLYQATKGIAVLAVEDWETGESVTIPIDPSHPPTWTLDKLYHQAKRLERVAQNVSARIATVRTEIAEMGRALVDLEQLTPEQLRQWVERLPKMSAGKAPAPQQPWTTWIGPDGQRVLVGRNAQGNRRLTFQVARGHDYWMHVRERPGSHLVIPVTKGQSPPLELLMAAAQIALATAKLSVGEAAEVQYTRARDVRPIPGEEGRVTLSNEKVLRVVREPAVLGGWAPEVTTESE
jgi:predicted ribosome quality control (RQC) complex YloA/Tae2 family protein